MSFTNPFHLITLIIFISNTFLIPIGYIKIFRFRNLNDSKVAGLCVKSRISRKKRNLVTIKFNLFNWVLETFSILIVLVEFSNFVTILYLLINSCGPPFVYFMGIEENRQAAAEYFRANIRIFKRNGENTNGFTTENEGVIFIVFWILGIIKEQISAVPEPEKIVKSQVKSLSVLGMPGQGMIDISIHSTSRIRGTLL